MQFCSQPISSFSVLTAVFRTKRQETTTLIETVIMKNKKYITSIVLEGIRTVLFFYQNIFHKNKTPKYLNTPKTSITHSLDKKCPDKIADKKDNNFLFKNKM